MNKDTVWNIFLLSLAAGAVLLGGSALVTAFSLRTALVSGFMFTVFQVLITGGIILVLSIVGLCASMAFSGLVQRVSDIEKKYGELLQKINKRTPTFVASSAIIASLVLLLADKAFDGQSVPTICVGVVLALLFWIANELLVADSKDKNKLGMLLWLISVFVLPTAVYIHHAGNLASMRSMLSAFGDTTITLLGLAFLVACFAPIALKRNG